MSATDAAADALALSIQAAIDESMASATAKATVVAATVHGLSEALFQRGLKAPAPAQLARLAEACSNLVFLEVKGAMEHELAGGELAGIVVPDAEIWRCVLGVNGPDRAVAKAIAQLPAKYQ